MGVLVSTMLFGVNLCRIRHIAAGMQRVRLGQQRIMRRLGMIAKLVPLGSELVIVCSGPVMFGGLQMSLYRWVSGHGVLLKAGHCSSVTPECEQGKKVYGARRLGPRAGDEEQATDLVGDAGGENDEGNLPKRGSQPVPVGCPPQETADNRRGNARASQG
jgi:hypothetical protein